MDVNYLAVLLAAIAAMVLGGLWYGPLFGEIWMKLTGVKMPKKDEMKKTMMIGYGAGFALVLLMAYTLAHFQNFLQVESASEAGTMAFWIWLGFMLPVLADSTLWENKPVKLLALNAVFRLVAILTMSLLIQAM